MVMILTMDMTLNSSRRREIMCFSVSIASANSIRMALTTDNAHTES